MASSRAGGPVSTSEVSSHRPMSFAEFVAIVASFIALNAFAIDMMLPALPEIGRAMNVVRENDRQAVLTALKQADYPSVRGRFEYAANQFPVQDYYLRVVERDASGRITNRLVETVFTDYRDSYVEQCKM